MSKTYSAGIATAYGAAKQGGYQGSYTDFCNDIAQHGDITAELGSISATATTLEAGSSATASYNDGVFSFGIPRGAQGERGADGVWFEVSRLVPHACNQQRCGGRSDRLGSK